MTTKTSLTVDEMKAFEPEAKIGLLATLSPQGQPHLTLITTLRAKTPTQLMWGQFSEGRSKDHVRDDPRVGFAVMNAARQLWRGKARWTHHAREGDDYTLFNHLPMFRYNSYFGIHTVHYMDLSSVSERAQISLPRLLGGTALSMLAQRWSRSAHPVPALKPWARTHLGKLTTLKYLAYVDDDGFPCIIPVVPCQPADQGRLVFVPTAYRAELAALAPGSRVAVLGLNLEMESVLLRGTFRGYRGPWPLRPGVIDIDWVYNSMPPLPGPIYPVEPLRPVTDFD